MGAIHFSFDPKLAEMFCSALPLQTFVETGTYFGDTVAAVRPHFKKIISIELSKEFHAQAQARFAADTEIELIRGESSIALKTLSQQLKTESVLYWLDAHWCAVENSAGGESQCPLLAELSSIAALNAKSVVVIDDARLFLAPPPKPHDVEVWPSFEQVINALKMLSGQHMLMVLNDCILFFPRAIQAAVKKFAQEQAVDWLPVFHKAKGYDELLLHAQEKDREIVDLKAICDEREALIQRLDTALRGKNQDTSTGTMVSKGLTATAPPAEAAEGQCKAMEELSSSIKGFMHQKDLELVHARTLATILREELAEKREIIARQFAAIESRERRYEQEIRKLQIQTFELRNGMQDKQDIDNRLTKPQDQVAFPEEDTGLSVSSHSLLQQIEELQATSDARLKVIEEQRLALEAFRKARWGERLKQFLNPRIGALYHHPPQPLKPPKRYTKLASNPPAISIVTPSFRQARYIERTLRSVINQNYPKLEYIVQDGGSEDGTVQILEQYATVFKHWESAKDNGQAHAINLGFKHATGEIMAYLNSDDLLLPGALHYVADFFQKNPHVDVVYGHRILIDEYDQEVGRWVLPPHGNKVLSWADYIPQETLFWRRRIWDKVGGAIDESFRFAMDWDLIIRFRDAGAKFVRLPRFLGAFRVHPHQKTSAEMTETGQKEMQRLRERCHGHAVDYREIRAGTWRYLAMHLVYDKFYRVLRLR